MNKTTPHEAGHQGPNGTGRAALTGVRHAAHRLRQDFDRLKQDRPALLLAASAGAGFAMGAIFASRVARLSLAFTAGYFTRDLLGKSGVAEELKRSVLSILAKPNEPPEA